MNSTPYTRDNPEYDRYSKYIPFFEEQKASIVDNWIKRLENENPDFYDSTQLAIQGESYFSLIFDIHIPIEQHPVYEQLKYWCELLFNKYVPIEHVLQSSAFFRESFFETIPAFDSSRADFITMISIIISRIDAFEMAVHKYFWSHARRLIEQKDKKLQDMHEDKLNLIGKMASSMAHEIRNPLTSIKGFFSLIRKTLSVNEFAVIEKYIAIIENEFHNIEMQIRGFLSFSKKPIVEEDTVPTMVKDLIDTTLLLMNPLLINENIELDKNLLDGLTVKVQKIAMQQVLSNLLNNAIDALREVEGERRITIRSFADQHYIYLQLTNTGPEIPYEIQQSVFDPFVTSKSDGTGLGLAICKQIVERNSGSISFVTGKQETSFIIRLDHFIDGQAAR